MAKWFPFIVTFLLSASAFAFQEAEVYRWVDENGNVHFSDMPRDANAKLVVIEPGITSKADTAEFPASNIPEASSDLAVSNDDSSDMIAAPNSAESCRDLRVEMKKRMRELNGTTPEKARLARIFVAEAEKVLADSGC